MLDIHEELVRLVDALDAQRIDYALCGGLANAIWCLPRATVDIELLVESPVAAVESIVTSLGYVVGANGITKTHTDGDTLALHLFQVGSAFLEVWNTRTRIVSDRGTISIVGREVIPLIGLWPRIVVEVDAPADDMSPRTITTRLIRVAQLRNLCLSLGKAKRAATSPKNKNARD